MLKLLPYFLFFILIIGCKEENEPNQNSFDLECEIIVQNELIRRTKSNIIDLKSRKIAIKRIDSLENELTKFNEKFKYLISKTKENNYDSVVNNLILKFNLKTPSKEQQEFLLKLLAYKGYNPHYSFYFDKLSGSIPEQYKKSYQAHIELKGYIENKVAFSRKSAYPNLPPKYYSSLETTCINYIDKERNKTLIDSAFKIINNDTTYKKIYLISRHYNPTLIYRYKNYLEKATITTKPQQRTLTQ